MRKVTFAERRMHVLDKMLLIITHMNYVEFQIGIVFTNFLIAFFAEAKVLHSFIETWARFQALIPSFMKVFFESSEKLDTGNIPLVIDISLRVDIIKQICPYQTLN